MENLSEQNLEERADLIGVGSVPEDVEFEKEWLEALEKIKEVKKLDVDSEEALRVAENILITSKIGIKNLEKFYDPFAKNANANHKDITRRRNERTAPYEEIESILKSKISSYILEQKEKGITVETSEYIEPRESWVYDIVDINEIEEEFLMPRAVNKSLLKTKVAALGPIAEEKISGIKVKKAITLAVKSTF